MTNHGASWVLGMHMCFGSLVFIASMEGELVWASSPATPRQAVSLDKVIETLGELRLYTPEARAPRSDLRLSTTNIEFMGMTDYVLESFYDLIMEGSETVSNSDSGRWSHHPSRECFVAEIRDVHDEGVHGGEATPSNGQDDEAEGEARAPHVE